MKKFLVASLVLAFVVGTVVADGCCKFHGLPASYIEQNCTGNYYWEDPCTQLHGEA